MGRVRTKTVKRAAKVMLETHYQKLTNDFHMNKKILSEVAKVPTKKLRNKIAGYATHLMKRIQNGPVKGISLKVQEEERERRLDWVPKESEIKLDKVPIDEETRDMIKKSLGDDFLGKISDKLDVKARELKAKKDYRDGRKGGKDQKRVKRERKDDRGDKEKTDKVEADKAERKQETTTITEGKTEIKEEGRRRGNRGNREGQE